MRAAHHFVQLLAVLYDVDGVCALRSLRRVLLVSVRGVVACLCAAAGGVLYSHCCHRRSRSERARRTEPEGGVVDARPDATRALSKGLVGGINQWSTECLSRCLAISAFFSFLSI